VEAIMTMVTRRAMTLATASAALGVAAGQRSYAAAAAPPGGARGFPNVLLTTHEGRRVRFYDDLMRGRIVVINFMYADCTGVCPRMTSNLVRVQQLLGSRVGRDVHMYSFTLKPREDTPEALGAYARMHGIGPGWLFLTGVPREIEQIRRALGFYDSDPVADRDTTNHIGLVLCGNEAIDRWASCPAIAEPSQLATLVGWMGTPAV
jgi:protein SCO1/2